MPDNILYGRPDGIPKLADHYYSYMERLPRKIRDAINYAPYCLNTETVYKVYCFAGEQQTLKWIDKACEIIRKRVEFEEKKASGEWKPKLCSTLKR